MKYLWSGMCVTLLSLLCYGLACGAESNQSLREKVDWSLGVGVGLVAMEYYAGFYADDIVYSLRFGGKLDAQTDFISYLSGNVRFFLGDTFNLGLGLGEYSWNHEGSGDEDPQDKDANRISGIFANFSFGNEFFFNPHFIGGVDWLSVNGASKQVGVAVTVLTFYLGLGF